MYKVGAVSAGLVAGPLVLGVTTERLAVTGSATVGYVLVGLALLLIGLLLARVGRAPVAAGPSRHRRLGRVLAALATASVGLMLLVFSARWRGLEAWTAARSIHLAVPHIEATALGNGIVVLREGSTSAAAFALTSECTMAFMLGAFLLGGGPLLIVRRLRMRRVVAALLAAALVLMTVNVLRLTAIGMAVMEWGQRGFSVSHLYLGSLLTFVGTSLAGAAFALVLMARRGTRVSPAPAS